MKKLILLAAFLFLASPATLYAATESAITGSGITEDAGLVDILDYSWRILALVAFAFTTYLGQYARKFLKQLTPERATDLVAGAIEKLGRSPETLKKILAAAFTVPEIRAKFDEAKTFAKTRINEIDEHILNYRIKVESGLLSDDRVAEVNRLIEKLYEERKELEDHAQKTD